jgi:hypothetical protein
MISVCIVEWGESSRKQIQRYQPYEEKSLALAREVWLFVCVCAGCIPLIVCVCVCVFIIHSLCACVYVHVYV